MADPTVPKPEPTPVAFTPPGLAPEPSIPQPQPGDPLPPAPVAPNLDSLFRGPVAVLVALLVLALVTVSLQALSGAWSSEFGGHPDEAAHYVTSLMMRDYIFGGGLPGHPMAFAQNYYDHYPKVALGHYPPGFYLLTAPWMAVFGIKAQSIMALLAVLSVLLAGSAFLWARRELDFISALLAGIGVALLPLVQRYTSLVMSDLALALACLLATWAFGRFMQTGKVRWSVAFAVLASGAVMVKASGLMLALVPPAAILLAWRWDLLTNWRLWVAPPLVALLIAPWTLLTYKIAEEGMQPWTLEYPLRSAQNMGEGLWYGLGWALLLAMLVGLVLVLRPLFTRGAGVTRRGLEPIDAVMLAFPLALLVFYMAVPSGHDQRYLLPVMPAALVLAVRGIHGVAALLTRNPATRLLLAGGLGALVLCAFFLTTFRIPDKHFHGFREAALIVAGDFEKDKKSKPEVPTEVLISSEANGEGAFIAEMAQLDRKRPQFVVQRSSKVLATSDWLGRDYEQAHATPEELAAYLAGSRLSWIVRDAESLPPDKVKEHHAQLEAALVPALRQTSAFDLTEQPLSIQRSRDKVPQPLFLYTRTRALPTEPPR